MMLEENVRHQHSNYTIIVVVGLPVAGVIAVYHHPLLIVYKRFPMLNGIMILKMDTLVHL